MATMLLGLVLAAALLVAAPALMQDRLLYYPARIGMAQGAATAGVAGLQPWPDAQDFRGWLAPTAAPARGSVIVFHGNAGHAGQRGFYAAALAPLGLRVILAEYPGYGPREGKPGEAALVDDAAQSIERAYRQFGAPLLVLGESLGAGVAAAAAALHADKVVGLVLITPWDKLQHVASYHYPWLPVHWLLRERYDSAAHLAAFASPVAVVIAEHDDIVPARFGHALLRALPGPKRLWTLDAGHNDWPLRVDSAWWRQVVDFVLAP